VVDGGMLTEHPTDAVADGSVSGVPLLIGTTRDESTFFTVGDPSLRDLDDAGLRRWTKRLSPDVERTEALIEEVTRARTSRGEPVTPRDLWVAIATEYVFRLPSVRLADAHTAAAAPGTGTYCYLFTWESPMFGGYLGSCHALDLPFVFGTVSNPAIAGFAGGGEDALALSAAMRRAWTTFARTGQPSPGWSSWDADRRPTMVFGPWPGTEGLERQVDRPRPEELESLSRLVPARVSG
jgi:para-nitrobenzyl esterase